MKRTISNDTPCRFDILIVVRERKGKTKQARLNSYHGICQMGVKDTFLFIILPVNLQKVRTKVVDNRFVVIGSIAE
jgi:hypothetical protein